MHAGSFTAAESDRERLRILTSRHEKYLETSFPGWGTYQSASLARQTSNGSLSALLWESRSGTANGLVLVTSSWPPAGVHGVWLEPSTPEILTEVLTDLEREIGSPLATVTDILPDIGPEAQSILFVGKGFWHREKVLMRREPKELVGRRSVPSEVRPIRREDLDAVVGLYVRAYTSRPGEFWVWGRPDPKGWADARDDVMSHLDSRGEWKGNFFPAASFVWSAEDRILGAVLVELNRADCPYIEDLIVEPEFHRRGIGRALMEATIERILQEGPRVTELAAIRFGAPYRFYQRLGFDEVSPATGRLDGHWVRGSSPLGSHAKLSSAPIV